MKKFYLKTALKDDQISAINKLNGHISGVEVQLLKPTDDLEKLFNITVPVLSIHYYLSKEEDDNKWYNCDSDLELIISNQEKLEMFERVCSYANKLGCSVGIHLNCGIERLDRDKIQRFVKISKKYPDVLIYIENIGLQRKSGYISNLPDLMKSVELLKSLGANVDMLVDTCHAEIASKLMDLNYLEEIEKYIKAADTSAKRVYVHLADAIKDGAGPNHGTNFIQSTDLKYLDVIMNSLNKCEKDVDIVLEVNDKDLLNKPLAFELLNYIVQNY